MPLPCPPRPRARPRTACEAGARGRVGQAAAALATAAVLGLAGCAAPSPGCGPGERLMASETLVFGRARPGGEVSGAEWAAFLVEVVTPRFPDGFSHWPAAGQWRGADGQVLREASEVLWIVHGDDPAAQARIGEVAALYRQRFDQEAVLRQRSNACVSF